MTDKIKLNGSPEQTVTWIWMDPTGGQLKVEYYDFSEDAQRFFGNDIAYTITVNDMDKLFSLAEQDKTLLIRWLNENFKSFFGIKQWLEENGIDFSIERESWA